MGRKGKYDSCIKPYLDMIPKWYEFCTEAQIAGRLGVSESAFAKYKRQHPELRDSLQEGKEKLVIDLKDSLKKKAKGYFYTETKTYIRKIGEQEVKMIEKFERYAQPDTGAIHLLLKNLDDTWRNDDKTTVDMRKKTVSAGSEANGLLASLIDSMREPADLSLIVNSEEDEESGEEEGAGDES